MTDSICTLADCDRPIYQHRVYCASHFMKWWRYGDPYFKCVPKFPDLTGQRFGLLVVVERRDGKWLCKCDCGDMALVRAGDLNRGGAQSCGDRKHMRKEQPGYSAAHDRVRRLHGSASNHNCIDCGSAAKHWSYDHADPDEFPQDPAKRFTGAYSGNPSHYQPRCVPCHKRYDLDQINASLIG